MPRDEVRQGLKVIHTPHPKHSLHNVQLKASIYACSFFLYCLAVRGRSQWTLTHIATWPLKSAPLLFVPPALLASKAPCHDDP